MTELKNVVVIGLGPGGAATVKALASSLPTDYRVVAIHDQSFAYWPIAALRASSVPGWEDKITVDSLDKLVPAGSRHVVLSSTKVLELRKNFVKVDREHESQGFGLTIPFEFAVVATGASYEFPCRAQPEDELATDVHRRLKEFQADVAAAKSVLVVGGGPAGTEFSGEVASQYPGKKVTLVHSREALFATGYDPRLGASLASQLEKHGVAIVYKSRVDTRGLATGKIEPQSFTLADGSTVEADFLFVAHGQRPNSHIVAGLDATLVDASGLVRVKKTLQLETSDSSLDNVFAIGDCNDVAEVKQARWAYHQGMSVVAPNIITLCKKNGAKLKEWTPSRPVASISVGPSGGASQVFGIIVGPWLTSLLLSKSLGVSGFKKMYS